MDFDHVFEQVFPALYRYCHRLTGDPDAAEDVAQEAFVRLYSNDVQGATEGVRVWLFRTATNLIRDRWRVRENRRRLLDETPVTPEAPPDPERELRRQEVVDQVRGVLADLPERDRQLLLMRVEGFSYREIGDAVGVKHTSVGTLLARAQQRFLDSYRQSSDTEQGEGAYEASG